MPMRVNWSTDSEVFRPVTGSTPAARPDSEKLLETIGSHLQSVFSAAGMTQLAARSGVVELLLATGTEDDDYLYFDGECDNSLPHRQHAAKLAHAVGQSLPDTSESLESLGMSLIRLGNYQGALDCFARQVKHAPENGYFWNNMAWCQFRLGRLEEACASCENAIRLLPEHPYLWHDRACILIGQGKLGEALTAIDHARKRLLPKSPQLGYLRAVVLQKRGKRHAAVTAWKEYLGEVTAFASHFRAFDRALKRLEGLHAGLWQWRVRRLRARMGAPRTSTAMLLKLLGLADHEEASYPPAEEESRSLQADRIAKRGWELFQRRNHSGAEAECRKAITSWPHSALARVLHARLALQRQDTDAYGKYVAMATIEQVFPPIAPVRQRALAEFVFFMMCVHAEKLYHDADYSTALSQLDEIDRVAPNNPMAVGLRRLVKAALSNRHKWDSFQERACASSPLQMPR